MRSVNEQQMIALIDQGQAFSGELEDGSLKLEILEYRPVVCTAIHDGHAMRPDLEANCLLTQEERLQEEDPHTFAFLAGVPIRICGGDSRYAYDLNRDPADPIYEIAWGKKVWRNPLEPEQRQESLERHHRYYRILTALMNKVRQVCGKALLIDLHSYCYQIRTYPEAPVFNTGTEQIQLPRWEPLLSRFETSLAEMVIPGVETIVGRDVVFKGKAWQARFMGRTFPEVPVIPLEIKKVYMNEWTGQLYPDVFAAIHTGLKRAIEHVEAELDPMPRGCGEFPRASNM